MSGNAELTSMPGILSLQKKKKSKLFLKSKLREEKISITNQGTFSKRQFSVIKCRNYEESSQNLGHSLLRDTNMTVRMK